MEAGKVDTLVMLGTNPVYTAPADLDFAAALAQVPLSVAWRFIPMRPRWRDLARAESP